MASGGELFTGFGDTGLDRGDELEGIVFVPPRETVRLASKLASLNQNMLPYPGCGYICLNST